MLKDFLFTILAIIAFFIENFLVAIAFYNLGKYENELANPEEEEDEEEEENE